MKKRRFVYTLAGTKAYVVAQRVGCMLIHKPLDEDRRTTRLLIVSHAKTGALLAECRTRRNAVVIAKVLSGRMRELGVDKILHVVCMPRVAACKLGAIRSSLYRRLGEVRR